MFKSEDSVTARGRDTARHSRSLSQEALRRLRADPEYWQGFHDGRPEAAREADRMLEDPTRPGGWCCPSRNR